jgi:hypothetical protein
MTQEQELERFKKVNACETLNELADVIESFADKFGVIQGRTKDFDAKRMATACRNYDYHRHNNLTREFGISQQGLYLLFYMDRKVPTSEGEEVMHMSVLELSKEDEDLLESYKLSHIQEFNRNTLFTLRRATKAALMDCKKALDANGGNYERSVAWLLERKHLKHCIV